MGGLTKFWDGYDNQPFVVIDDPGLFDPRYKEDKINAFKNVISSEKHTVGREFFFCMCKYKAILELKCQADEIRVDVGEGL